MVYLLVSSSSKRGNSSFAALKGMEKVTLQDIRFQQVRASPPREVPFTEEELASIGQLNQLVHSYVEPCALDPLRNLDNSLDELLSRSSYHPTDLRLLCEKIDKLADIIKRTSSNRAPELCDSIARKVWLVEQSILSDPPDPLTPEESRSSLEESDPPPLCDRRHLVRIIQTPPRRERPHKTPSLPRDLHLSCAH